MAVIGKVAGETATEEQGAPRAWEAPAERAEAGPRPLPEDYWEGELVSRDDPRAAFVSINPERTGGTPCFVGTRVPIENLWDYLEGGGTLEGFIEDFEGVPRAEALAALRSSRQRLLDGLPEVVWDR